MPAAEIEADLAALSQWLEPAGADELATQLDRLFDLFDTPQNWASISQIYTLALGALPSDMLEETVTGTLLNCSFFPKPVELINRIPVEFHRRLALQRRLEFALTVSRLEARRHLRLEG